MQTFIREIFYVRGGKLYKRNTLREVGWVGNNGYKMFDYRGKKYLVHRAIFLIHYGYLPDMVDHIDRNKLNNCPSNLRPTNKSLNALNTGLRSDNSSGYKGVSWSKPHNKWAAYVFRNGKKKHIGLYHSALAAHIDREKFLEGDSYDQIH